MWLVGCKCPCRGTARWQRNGDSQGCKRNLGKKPPGRVLPLRKAPLGWGIFLPCSPLSGMKMRGKKETIPHLLLTFVKISKKMQVRVGTLLDLLWKKRADPKRTCYLCKPSFPPPAMKPQPTHASSPPGQAPSPAFLSQLLRNHKMLLTCGSFSLPLPLPSLCTDSGRCCCFCCFSCCK